MDGLVRCTLGERNPAGKMEPEYGGEGGAGQVLEDIADVRSLNLPTETEKLARRICQELLPLLTAEQGAVESAAERASYLRIWRSCVAYIAKNLQAGKSREGTAANSQNGGKPLSEILKATGADLFEFFRELPATLCKLTPRLRAVVGEETASLEQLLAVKQWQTTLVVTVILAKKYKDLYTKLFANTEGKDLSTVPSFRFGWLLLSTAKHRLLPKFPDLFSSFCLLLSVCNFLLVNTPRKLWQLDANTNFGARVKNASGPFNSLKEIAEMNKLVERDQIERTETATKELGEVIEGLLDASQPCKDAQKDSHPDAPDFVPSCPYYEGLLDPKKPLLNDCVKLLEDKYMEVYMTSGEIDERDFIKEGFIPTQHSNSGHASNLQVSNPGQANVQSPITPVPAGVPHARLPHSMSPVQAAGRGRGFHSPIPGQGARGGAPPATPVTESMNTMSWLTGFIAGKKSEPSEKLVEYFNACDHDVGPIIRQRVCDTCELVFPNSSHSDGRFAPEEADRGVKVYYRSLESLLIAEEKQSHKRNFTSLLTSNSFHQALLACSFEIVVETQKMAALTFPVILDRLTLKAFDFSKVIEMFVRHTPTLPRQLKLHFFLIEERIIESMAWEPGSTIYHLIAGASSDSSPQAGQQTPTPVTPKSDKQGDAPQPSLPLFSPSKAPPSGLAPGTRSPTSAFRVFISPLKGVRGDSCNPHASPTRFTGPLPIKLGFPQNTTARPHPARTVLIDFFRKVLKLSSIRLRDLMLDLSFDQMQTKNILHQVCCVVHHALYEQTELFYNRHLDQILLSALYGVCKVNRLNDITFREIIQHYKKQRQARPEVYKAVPLKQTDPDLLVEQTGDIIEFYNQLFIQKLRPFLLSNASAAAAPAEGVEGTKTPPRSRLPAENAMSMSPFPGHQQLRQMLSQDMASTNWARGNKNVHISPLPPQPTHPSAVNTTRSMYAFAGKSAHPYETPSQELNIINARLNSPGSRGFPLKPLQAPPTAQQVQATRPQPVTSSPGHTGAPAGPSEGPVVKTEAPWGEQETGPVTEEVGVNNDGEDKGDAAGDGGDDMAVDTAGDGQGVQVQNGSEEDKDRVSSGTCVTEPGSGQEQDRMQGVVMADSGRDRKSLSHGSGSTHSIKMEGDERCAKRARLEKPTSTVEKQREEEGDPETESEGGPAGNESGQEEA